jgi:glycerol-3-phosphate cytidylyltransferase
VLQRAAELGDRLVVGVSSDALNIAKKGRAPVFNEDERLEIISSLRVVDGVFLEESLEQKRDYILEQKADILVMGDDWAGKFDWVKDVCDVVYLPRTPSVSTTGLIEHIAGLS